MRTLTFNRVLGSGAMGTVYHAELRVPQAFARQCAVKVLHAAGDHTEQFRQRMRDEARLLGMLQDEHVLKVIELTRVEGRDCVIMEYVEGADLLEILQHGRPPARALCELGAILAGTLHRAHTATHPNTDEPLNVIHRDVKPANVMITAQGGVRLLDFGVARARFDSRESHTHGLVLGTLNYFPPEVMQGKPPSPQVDLYGLGLTLWEAVMREEWGAPTAHETTFNARREERIAGLPAEYAALAPVLAQLICYRPEDRGTGSEVEDLLNQAARASDGDGLRDWARSTVPTLIRTRPPVDSDALVGQTLPLGDPPKSKKKKKKKPKAAAAPGLEVIDPPLGAMDPQVMTYNDLAPPAAVGRTRPQASEPASQPATAKPSGPPVWALVLAVVLVGVGCGGAVGITGLAALLVILSSP